MTAETIDEVVARLQDIERQLPPSDGVLWFNHAILAQTEAKTKQWLLTGAIKELDHAVAPVDDAVAIWSIEKARDVAWIRSEVLWQIRDQSVLLNAYLDALDATVGMECCALLLPHGL